MSKLKWDQTGEKQYETGVDHGVLYIPDEEGAYAEGHAWNGLVSVSESPTGAEATALYADNIKYLSLISAEEFGGTIEAFTYPVAFEQCDGTASPAVGVTVGQQRRKTFGFSYRTLIGNDLEGTDFGFKIHLVYGANASPSEKARNTVNESPEAVTFSWEFTTTPVEVPGFKPSATITIDSTKVSEEALSEFLDVLYGTEEDEARLPLPEEVFEFFGTDVIVVTPTEPVLTDDQLAIPSMTGVIYNIGGEPVSGTITIEENTTVTATPAVGYTFPVEATTEWTFTAP